MCDLNNENNNFAYTDMNSYFPSQPMNPEFNTEEFVTEIPGGSQFKEELRPTNGSSNRGRKKQRKRGSGREQIGKSGRGCEIKSANDTPVEDNFFPSKDLNSSSQISNKDITLHLEEILAQKKMELLQNPEVQELLQQKMLK